jgi:hypothetical protein
MSVTNSVACSTDSGCPTNRRGQAACTDSGRDRVEHPSQLSHRVGTDDVALTFDVT